MFVRDGATFSLLEVVKYRWRVFNVFVGRIGDDSFRVFLVDVGAVKRCLMTLIKKKGKQKIKFARMNL